ncbi:Urease accessory protein UreF [Bienertia sinuspersici]
MEGPNGETLHVPYTYKEHTLEFLSTLHFKISFTIFGQHYEINLDELNEYFLWSKSNTVKVIAEQEWGPYLEQERWAQITDGTTPFHSATSKALKIQHPTLRYFLRYIMYCLFSRVELGKIYPDELRLLWMVTKGYALQPLHYNFGYSLARRFADIAEGSLTSAPSTLEA